MSNGINIFLTNLIGNLKENFLEITIITSRTRGAIKSFQKPYGAGKSTLAFYLSYILHYYDAYEELPISYEDNEVWDKVFDNACYTIDEVVKKISSTTKRIPSIIWDDAQITAPAVNPPLSLKQKINYLTVARPYVSNILITAPSLSDISAPLRRLIKYEIIVPARGVFEIQFIERRKNFYKPLVDIDRLIYISQGKFNPLPPHIQKRYNEWRDQKVRLIMGTQELNEPPPGFVDLKTFAKAIGYDDGTIRNYCRQGKLVCVKIKDKYYVSLTSMSFLIEKHNGD